MNVGAVGALRRIKSAISVARHVLEHTKHSFLAGELATQFAVQMGFKEETLTTQHSKSMWTQWFNKDHCQPNFWMVTMPQVKQSLEQTVSNHVIPIVRNISKGLAISLESCIKC